MINLSVVIGILIIHWIADFLCQTDWMAKGKSKEWIPLLAHTIIYSLIWSIGVFFLGFTTSNAFHFVYITFVIHTITDYFTSRLNSKLWAEGKVHWFFVSIGFDQILHYVQLLLTYYLLK